MELEEGGGVNGYGGELSPIYTFPPFLLIFFERLGLVDKAESGVGLEIPFVGGFLFGC